MRFLGIIPARGGSKGVPRKNIRAIMGKPLIAHTIEAAEASGVLDRIVVSTDDDEIASVSRQLGAEVMMRPAHLAEDGAPTLPVLLHVVEALEAQGYAADAVVTLQPTSPLRKASHLIEAAAAFEAAVGADSLVSCISVPHIFHPRSVMALGPDGFLRSYLDQSSTPTRRQDKEPVFARNGAAIYITRRARLPEYIFGGNLLPYFMEPEDSLDIDTEADLAEAEKLLTARAGQR